ncbi:MAG: hypothetical protein M3P16_08840 [Chloroflexota bacterium]|nr:hypothetical protein [Chloroflexota bacterium]
MSRVGVLATSLGLIIACAAPVPAPPKVFDVQIDARASSFSLAASVFFPREIAVHAGDTVRFTAIDRGEVHTVTFGKLVDAALETFAKLPPGAQRPTLESLGLPPVLLGEPLSSLGRTATLPCFVDRGPTPGPDGCRPEQQVQPDLTGGQTLFNSGYLAGGDIFAVRLAASMRPGAYGFICLLHGPDMSGRIVLEENSRSVASPSEVVARGTADLDLVVRQLEPLVAGAARDRPNGTIVSGVSAPGIAHTQATVFRPVELTARRGEPVSWSITGFHTISFNAPQDAVGLVVRASDRSWALNPRLLAAEQSADPTAGGRGGPRIIESGVWNGRGFRSSGLIDADPGPRIYRVTFSEPGTYSYKCLLHPDMEGTVKVTN